MSYTALNFRKDWELLWLCEGFSVIVWWYLSPPQGNPCNMHLLGLAEKVKQGVRSAGMIGYRFNTIGVSDGISMGTNGMSFSLQSRGMYVCPLLSGINHGPETDCKQSYLAVLPGARGAAHDRSPAATHIWEPMIFSRLLEIGTDASVFLHFFG